MSQVWEDQTITNCIDLIVLLAIADFANDDGSAWPSVETIAKKSRQSERNVHYTLKRLMDSEKLVVAKNAGPKGTNLYRVLARAPNTAGVQVVHPGVQGKVRGGANSVSKGCKSFAPEPSGTVRNHQGEGPPNGNGRLEPSQRVVFDKEYDRVLAKMRSISNAYSDHQTWSELDRINHRALKARRDELRAILKIEN